MKKGTLHIHLMNMPSKMSNEGKNQVNIVHLCNGRKGFSVVNDFLLRKSLHDKA
jgi:hypothetical protein